MEDYKSKYENAIEVVKKYRGTHILLTEDVIEEMFPELKDTEDEEIRKGIIRCIKCNMPDNDFRKKYLAWFEKQGDHKPVEWSEQDETHITNIIIMLKEGASLHFTEDNITKSVSWLKSIKNRVQPKQEWSDEDEATFTVIGSLILDNFSAEDASKTLTWLHSLRPQNTWKPSDEQMKALDIALKAGIQLGTWEEKALRELKEQLL